MELDTVGSTSGSTFDRVRYNTSGQLTTAGLSPNDPAWPGPQTDWQYQVQNGSAGITNGYRIFAFNGSQESNVDGEYRITMGNFSGSTLAYPDCNATVGSSGIFQGLKMGDASYGGTNGAGAYEYSVTSANSNATCSSTGYTTYYAREWITKYVTQLYTDIAMTTKASFPSTYTRRFKRTGINQEGTVDGTYLAPFDTNGLRDITSPANASKGCVL